MGVANLAGLLVDPEAFVVVQAASRMAVGAASRMAAAAGTCQARRKAKTASFSIEDSRKYATKRKPRAPSAGRRSITAFAGAAVFSA